MMVVLMLFAEHQVIRVFSPCRCVCLNKVWRKRNKVSIFNIYCCSNRKIRDTFDTLDNLEQEVHIFVTKCPHTETKYLYDPSVSASFNGFNQKELHRTAL